MLTSRGVLGIAVADPGSVEAWGAVLQRAEEAGAGAVRASVSGAGSEAVREQVRRIGLTLVVACPASRIALEGPSPLILAGVEPEAISVTLEASLETEADTRALPEALARVGGRPVVLGLAPIVVSSASGAEAKRGVAPLPSLPAAPGPAPANVCAIGLAVHGGTGPADPKRMEDVLRSLAATLRAGGWQQPYWITDLSALPDATAEQRAAWLVKHAAHALALQVKRVFLRLPFQDPEPTLQALAMLSAWLEGAQRITWLALGQYRAEFGDRPNRYLLWADPEPLRLPSSFQGPLHVRDLAGEERRVETSRLRLSDLPLLVERRPIR